jgi:polar amino acid transport system substrate-binding protein
MRKHHIALVALVAVAAISLLILFARGRTEAVHRENALAHALQTKTLNVGYIIFPPAITKDPNTHELGGHFVLAVKDIAAQAGLEPVFIETDWKGFAAGLKSRRFDVSIAPTFVTVPRSLTVAFTDPLFYAGNGVVVGAGETRFTDIASFNRPDVTIAVTQGSAAHEFAERNLTRAQLRILPGADQLLALQEVVAGRADAGFANDHDTAKFVEQNPGRVKDLFADHPYNLTPVSWAVATDQPEMLSFLNNSLRALDAQGRLVEYEHSVGARWLHPVREYRLTGSSIK